MRSIFQASHKLPFNFVSVISVYQLFIKRPSKKMVEVVTKRNILNSTLCARSADFCGTLWILPFPLWRNVVGAFSGFPASSAEYRRISNLKNIKIWVNFDTSI